MKYIIILLTLACFILPLKSHSQTVPEYERCVEKVRRNLQHFPEAKREFDQLLKKISKFEFDQGDLRFSELQIGFLVVKTASRYQLLNKKEFSRYCTFLERESNTDCEEQGELYDRFKNF
jgi:hypothetical protein